MTFPDEQLANVLGLTHLSERDDTEKPETLSPEELEVQVASLVDKARASHIPDYDIYVTLKSAARTLKP